MKHSRRIATVAAVLLAVGAAGFGGVARAEIRAVDGHLWSASSVAEKRAYLIGIANTVAVNRALQVKHGNLDAQSANNRIAAALDAGTIDRAVDRIDAWYAANPARKDAPVMGVVWMSMVKGN
jgi:hypothetical protein